MNISAKRVVSYFAYFGFLTLIFGAIYLARVSLMPYIVGIFIAYLGYPFVKIIDKKVFQKIYVKPAISRALAIVVYIVLLVLACFTFFWTLGDLLVTQLVEIVKQITQVIENAYSQISGVESYVSSAVDVQAAVKSINLDSFIFVKNAFSSVASAVGFLFSLGIALFMLPFWVYYLLQDPKQIRKGVLRLIPQSLRSDADQVGKITNNILQNYIRAQVFLMFIIFSMSLVGFILIGMPNALALAFIAGLLEAIPTFGPIIAWVVSFVVAVPLGLEKMFWVSIVSLVVQQVENNFLVPRIQGHTVSFPAYIVMIIVVIYGALFGLVGMIIGLPLTAIMVKVIQYIHIRLVGGKGSKPSEARKQTIKEPIEFKKLNI
jgi:predicted PurR-regulated permease PerM